MRQIDFLEPGVIRCLCAPEKVPLHPHGAALLEKLLKHVAIVRSSAAVEQDEDRPGFGDIKHRTREVAGVW